MDLESALVAFIEATKPERGDPRMRDLGQQLLDLAMRLQPDSLTAVMHRLMGALDAPHPQTVGFVALLCGCMVENGADPGSLASSLLPTVERALTLARPATEAASDLREADEDERDDSAVWVGDKAIAAGDWQAIVDRLPASTQSFMALDHLCQALIAALTRSPALLKTPEVQKLSEPLRIVEEAAMYCSFLARLLRVPMSEEWVVVDPKNNRGFQLRVSGLANAFQVYALVHAALGTVRRSLSRWSPPVAPGPAKDVLAVARGDGPQSMSGSYVPPFTLYRWSAITKARSVPDFNESDDWYCMSAVPAELARFEGKRVVVIGEYALAMQFGIAREFGALKADVTLERELDKREVVELLWALAAAPHPGYPVPGVGWP